MRNLIVGGFIAAALSGCAGAGSTLRPSEGHPSGMLREVSTASGGFSRTSIGLGSSSNVAAQVDRHEVCDSQDPIPITPVPVPSGSGGDPGNPTPGNPAATGKR
jgi:hypothetical protein